MVCQLRNRSCLPACSENQEIHINGGWSIHCISIYTSYNSRIHIQDLNFHSDAKQKQQTVLIHFHVSIYLSWITVEPLAGMQTVPTNIRVPSTAVIVNCFNWQSLKHLIFVSSQSHLWLDTNMIMTLWLACSATITAAFPCQF